MDTILSLVYMSSLLLFCIESGVAVPPLQESSNNLGEENSLLGEETHFYNNQLSPITPFDFYQMPKSYEGWKRAPSVGFYGMRGKKVPVSNFYGMRGKKGPAGFMGMRGKKNSEHLDENLEEEEFKWKTPLFSPSSYTHLK